MLVVSEVAKKKHWESHVVPIHWKQIWVPPLCPVIAPSAYSHGGVMVYKYLLKLICVLILHQSLAGATTPQVALLKLQLLIYICCSDSWCLYWSAGLSGLLVFLVASCCCVCSYLRNYTTISIKCYLYSAYSLLIHYLKAFYNFWQCISQSQPRFIWKMKLILQNKKLVGLKRFIGTRTMNNKIRKICLIE